MKKSLTDSELRKTYNMTIYSCIRCAGGFSRVAKRLKKAASTPRRWAELRYNNGRGVPKKYRAALCEMTQGRYKPEELGVND